MSPAPTERRARRARRRRLTARGALDSSVPSPCISVCQIDDQTGLCLGCVRSIDEIRDWIVMSAEQKMAVLARIAKRKAARDDT